MYGYITPTNDTHISCMLFLVPGTGRRISLCRTVREILRGVYPEFVEGFMVTEKEHRFIACNESSA